MMDILGVDFWAENTVHGYPKTREEALKRGPSTPWYINYRYSQSHYEAMIAEKYHYAGSSNCYISDYKKNNPDHPNAAAVYVQFDVFVPDLTTHVHS